MRMNWRTAARLTGASTRVVPVLSIAHNILDVSYPYNSMDAKEKKVDWGFSEVSIANRRYPRKIVDQSIPGR